MRWLELAAADRKRLLRRVASRAGLSPPPPFPSFEDGTTLLTDGTLRFAGGDGAQRRSGRRIFGTRLKGRTARTGRSVAHTLRCLYQRTRRKRRVSEGERRGTSTTTHRERRSGTHRDDNQKDPSSGRGRGGVSQRDSESDARAR